MPGLILILIIAIASLCIPNEVAFKVRDHIVEFVERLFGDE